MHFFGFQFAGNCWQLLANRLRRYWSKIDLRLCLFDRATVERDGVKCVCKSILHVLIEIDAICRAGAVVFTLAAAGIAGRGY